MAMFMNDPWMKSIRSTATCPPEKTKAERDAEQDHHDQREGGDAEPEDVDDRREAAEVEEEAGLDRREDPHVDDAGEEGEDAR